LLRTGASQMNADERGFAWGDADCTNAHGYLLPALLRILRKQEPQTIGSRRLFDLGCGNGSVANALHENGWRVSGIDASSDGIAQARRSYPHLDLHQASAYEDLSARFGRFPLLISLEVVEHLYYPRKFAKAAFDLLEPGGAAIISTPYHGYLKNLILALSGKMDRHFTALWDHGHIKFWSVASLSSLLQEAGFLIDAVYRIGRMPPIAKSMIVVARKPV